MTTEHDKVQAAIIKFRDTSLSVYPDLWYLYHNNNGGKMTVRQRVANARKGELPGVWDLFWPYAKNGRAGLYMEIKIPPDKLSPAQERFGTAVWKQGFRIEVVNTAQQGIDVLLAYLGKGKS